jgi:hypothetical protein
MYFVQLRIAAERQGFEYWVEEPKEPKFRVKSYANNFKSLPRNCEFSTLNKPFLSFSGYPFLNEMFFVHSGPLL